MFYVCHEITKGELAGKHTKLICESLKFYCYYVLAAVHEISFISWIVNLNPVINCWTPTVLAMRFNFNCNA